MNKFQITCSITSGAIQQGVPTKVCLALSRESCAPPGAAINELTPRSASITVPSSPRSMLPALMSLQRHKFSLVVKLIQNSFPLLSFNLILNDAGSVMSTYSADDCKQNFFCNNEKNILSPNSYTLRVKLIIRIYISWKRIY